MKTSLRYRKKTQKGSHQQNTEITSSAWDFPLNWVMINNERMMICVNKFRLKISLMYSSAFIFLLLGDEQITKLNHKNANSTRINDDDNNAKERRNLVTTQITCAVDGANNLKENFCSIKEGSKVGTS